VSRVEEEMVWWPFGGTEPTKEMSASSRLACYDARDECFICYGAISALNFAELLDLDEKLLCISSADAGLVVAFFADTHGETSDKCKTLCKKVNNQVAFSIRR
jgi:hypothetical protein